MHILISFIESLGYLGYVAIFITIFLESFPITFFLPGDSLLFTTGFLASQGHFDLPILVGVLFMASVLGYMFSYAMGQKFRELILSGKTSKWFSPKHLEKTQKFFDKYGAKTIIIGRFVPIVRSFSPTFAGAVAMHYRKFIKYTVAGAILWSSGMTSLGFYLGRSLPNADKYLTPIVLGIIVISMLPSVVEYIISRKEESK